MKLLKPSTALMLLAAVALTAGCAARRREAYVQDKAHNHVYRMPLAELFPHARQLMVEKGYSLRESKGGFEVQTEWLQTSAASSLGTTFQRYLVRGIERGPGQSSVEFIKMVRNESRGADNVDENGGRGGGVAQTGAATQTQPDLEMEWELLQRVDAEAAKTYQGEAEAQFK
jgi:uncharacterized lipoprotein